MVSKPENNSNASHQKFTDWWSAQKVLIVKYGGHRKYWLQNILKILLKILIFNLDHIKQIKSKSENENNCITLFCTNCPTMRFWTLHNFRGMVLSQPIWQRKWHCCICVNTLVILYSADTIYKQWLPIQFTIYVGCRMEKQHWGKCYMLPTTYRAVTDSLLTVDWLLLCV